MRKVIGLLLSVIMVVGIVVSFGVVAAPAYSIQADPNSAILRTNYVGSQLATSSQISVKRADLNIVSYAQTRLYANGSIACTGASRKLTRQWITASSGWATTDHSKTYSGRLYGRGLATNWVLLVSWY